ncbi:MAG TPA: DEAD/DEAH box helicase, partial [Planctomycetota bacterium]|nr:DEAD/DEAH box helicase [Planctomycetota bacterium]
MIPRAAPPLPGLEPLKPEDPVVRVPGVAVARASSFARLGVLTVLDLLRLAPRRFEDRRTVTPVRDLAPAPEATVLGRVARVRVVRARGGLAIVELDVDDGTGVLRARWFNQPWIAKAAPEGARVLLHGEVRASGSRLEMASPAVERAPEDPSTPHPGLWRLVPVHPATQGLSPLVIRRAVWSALEAIGPLADPLPPAWRLAAGPSGTALPTLDEAIRALHFPSDAASAEEGRRRLAFDELLVHELLLARRRAARRAREAIPFRFTPTLERRIRARFPFVLTPAQDRAAAEIRADLERPEPMNRLLQGDVGAGKTLVAAYACLACVANGAQAAFMAPTEVLARQHEATLRRLLEGSEVRIEALYGGTKGKARTEALARVASGEAGLVVGTHAVLSRDVRFARLALVVVDEQHKFGVAQRRDLVVKGPSPHCLVMTATPIPRTLAMVVFGDLDVTVIDALPPGRVARATWVVRPAEGERVLARVREELAAGRQAFVVYPLVEESDRTGLRDAT